MKKYKIYLYFIFIYIILFSIILFSMLHSILQVSNKIFFISFLFYFILILIYFFKLNKEKLKDSFKKEFMDIVIISFLVILFFSMAEIRGQESDKIDLNLPFHTNKFGITFHPQYNIMLNDLSFNYDFKSREGQLSFLIIKHNDSLLTDNFDISLPKQINITNFSLEKEGIKLIENKDFRKKIKYSNDSNEITFNDFKIDLEKVSVNLILKESNEYHPEFHPNGLFRFYVFARRVNSKSLSPIIFKLGEYKCKNICFGKLINSEPEINNNILKIRYPGDYYPQGDDPKILEQIITLNTYYLPHERNKTNLKNFQIALMIAGLVLLGEMLRKFVLLQRYLNK